MSRTATVVGDRVSFYDDNGARRVGEVVKASKRTLVVVARGFEWDVDRSSVDVVASRMPRAA